MAFSLAVDVRFADLDAMGHVNHAVFISYLEHARIKWWNLWLDGRDFLEEGFLIARVEIDYRKPILLEDAIRVNLRCTHVGSSSFAVGYTVLRERDQVVLAEAQTVQVMMDFRQHRPRALSAQAVAWLNTQR